MDWAAPNLPAPTKSPVLFDPTDLSKLDLKIQKELSRLDPAVPFRPVGKYLHHTWAQTFFSRPELFFQPESIPELQKIITLARRCRRRICVTGFGHSPSDLTCTSSWLINLDHLDKVLEFNVDNTPGRIRFQAGISLHNLNLALAKRGFTLPNLGSIDVQSLAGSISTGTHGSSLQHGFISESVTSLTVLLSNSQLVSCSATKNPDLFRAALISLGSLGIIVEMTFQAVPDFNIAWNQRLVSLEDILSNWSTSLWTEAEFTRVWWLPYLKRAVVWRATKTNEPPRPPNESFYGGMLGFHIYHNLLALSNYIPRILPWIEWFVFGMQYGFKPNSYVVTAVQPAREGLLMDCLFSQFVNEWAIPLERGPEAIRRLAAWINGDEKESRIPFSSKGIWVHCPVEVRVSDTNTDNNISGVRPFLAPTNPDGPTLYLNATLYRAYGWDPPCHKRYFEAFEWLMRDLGGRPHWAKNFAYTSQPEISAMYGSDMQKFMTLRDELDPDHMFLGEWHRRNLPISVPGTHSMLEGEFSRKQFNHKHGDSQLWEGKPVITDSQEYIEADNDAGLARIGASLVDLGATGSEIPPPSPPTTSASEESFDYMAKGEASVYAEQ